MKPVHILIIYLLIINTVSFAAMGSDKRRAKRRARRTRESTLLLLAAVGGSVGSALGMGVFHHKTQHRKFYIGIPVIFLIHLVLCAAYIIVKYR
ncbi:MAG: DUF1294 domain-containing protein [Oscillospiraceae bacterium]|nr:DUF1294 domain-containing protein [Oscillospiraceae bacterium]